MLNYQRYKRVPVVDFPERTWPNKEIMKAPIWCSVDLRDGNQALVEPRRSRLAFLPHHRLSMISYAPWWSASSSRMTWRSRCWCSAASI